MTNVLIADDEEKICRLILALGDWSALGMSVTGTVSNGVEAAEYIKNNHTDILITDIRMPGLNGVELIDRIHRISPSTRVIIVSGYAEFEYAQTALHYGVSDYLLKPINKKQLNDALRKLKDKIDGEKDRETTLENTKTQLVTNESTVRSSLISDIIINPDLSLSEDTLRDKYRFNAGKDSYRFLCIKLDDGDIAKVRQDDKDSRDAAPERDFFWDKIISVLNVLLTDLCHDMVTLTQGRYLYALLNYSSKNEDDLRKAVRGCLHQTNSFRGILRNEQAAFALGIQVRTADDIGRSLRAALMALKDRLIKGNAHILDAEPSTGVLYDKKLLDHYSNTVTHALEVMDKDEITEEIDRLGSIAGDTPGVRGWEIYELAEQMGSMLMMRLDFPDKKRRLDDYNEACDNSASLEDLIQIAGSFAGGLIDEIRSQREDSSARPVRLAKQYISKHYAEPVTLEGISEQLNLTPTYFSALFKKETGMGFSKYLAKHRIDAAKELLRESNLSVSEVCARVGYSDTRHFNRIFEQDAGVKPAVYRKLYG